MEFGPNTFSGAGGHSPLRVTPKKDVSCCTAAKKQQHGWICFAWKESSATSKSLSKRPCRWAFMPPSDLICWCEGRIMADIRPLIQLTGLLAMAVFLFFFASLCAASPTHHHAENRETCS
jgi:hypothetical protein